MPLQAAPVCCRLALCQAGRSSHSDTSSFPGGLLISECQGLGRSRAGAEQQLSEADQPRGPQIGPFVFPGDTSLTLDLASCAPSRPASGQNHVGRVFNPPRRLEKPPHMILCPMYCEF